MTLDPVVAAAVLLAALLHATWNAMLKAGSDRLLTMALIQLTSVVVGLVLVLLVPLPAGASWPFLILSTLLHVGYQLFLLLAYRVGDLNQVYPIARGLGPLLVALFGAWVFGERLSPSTHVGILVVCLGLFGLGYVRAGAALASRKPLAYAAGTGVIIALYTITDALGVRLSGNPLSYIAWLTLLDGPALVVYFLWRRGPVGFRVPWAQAQGGVLGGVLTIVAYALVLWAYDQGPVAPIAALRETSVIFAALIGSRLLHEPLGGRRITAATVVAAGAILINLG